MIQLNLEQCVFTACLWEATARKAGNVHRYADFRGLTYLDFIQSAHAIAPVIANLVDAPIGETVLECIKATRKVANTNTNLGIVLLLVPLSKIWYYAPYKMQALLAQTTVEDAENVYEAIRYAVPGGMGEVESEDVSRRPTKKLLEVMSMSADRDNIGYQYANDFAPIIEMGVQKFTETIQTGCPIERAIMQNQMEWLGRYPDSLIARKLGREETRIIRDKAKEFFLEGEFETVEGRKLYRLLDRFLRLGRNKLNPGTTADLVTATLFVWLRTNPIDPAWRFTWTEYDR